MARILGIGNATLDIINTVDGFPAEDTEVRALAQRICRGGNAANTLVVLSQLGHSCEWLGVLADEPDAKRVVEDLRKNGVSCSPCCYSAAGKLPVSYVTLNARNGSRSIVHYRDLPELDAEHFSQLDLTPFDWLHFEGRNIPELARMLARVRKEHPAMMVSLEVEKPRRGFDALFPFADLLLFARAYAHAQGYGDARQFLDAAAQRLPNTDLVCAWGEAGAWARSRAGATYMAPAWLPARVVDTLGAGDTFNAGIIDARMRGLDWEQALGVATELSGRKCGQVGFEHLLDNSMPSGAGGAPPESGRTARAPGSVLLCSLDDLDDPGARGFYIEDASGVAAIFVVRRGDNVFGYLNQCPHMGVSLEWTPDQFLNIDGTLIQCSTHGAQFRIDDGYCVYGPCSGQALAPLALSVDGAEIRLHGAIRVVDGAS